MVPSLTFEFFLNLILLIFLIVFCCLFFIHNRKELQFYWYLVLASFLALATQIINFLSSYVIQHYVLTRIVLILYIMIFYVFYLHYETISYIKIPLWRHSLMFSLLTLCLMLVITVSFNLYTDFNSINNFTGLLYGTFVLLCMCFSFKVTLHTYKLTKERANFIEVIAIFILLFLYILTIIRFSLTLLNIITLETTSRILMIITAILILISLTTILTNFLIRKDYFYRIPFPIHQIMVINKAGILAYIRRVSPSFLKQSIKGKVFIMSGFIKALSAIVIETLGTKSRLKYIDTGAYQIYFSEIRENGGIIAIITSGGNSFLQKSLDRFANTISSWLLDEIQKPEVYSEKIQKQIDIFIAQAFPYVKIVKD
ncbi:MAG: hypothetical protein ACFFAH_02565 [Promethearchaeota archaeon]